MPARFVRRRLVFAAVAAAAATFAVAPRLPAQGPAPADEHWSLRPPPREPFAPPAVRDAAWPRGPLDRFVLARIEAVGETPAPEADLATRIRRVTLDLTGLPPTLATLDAALADPDPDTAYARVVDELLSSVAHAEHQARFWLDAARYGDTHGYHLDNVRSLWPWRDWVVDAIHGNKPFDEFTIEQLAGDLLPEPTRAQRIATGFNRCNPTTGEGGLIADEYLVKYAQDRVDTTATVWMGLTVHCAQCHDHKYDPISQREYYRLYAFFNNVAEEASDRNALVPPPALRAPTPEQERELAGLESRIAALADRLDAPMPDVDAAESRWAEALAARDAAAFTLAVPTSVVSRGGATMRVDEHGVVTATGALPTHDEYEFLVPLAAGTRTRSIRVETLLHDEGDHGHRVGRASHGNIVLTSVAIQHAPASEPFAVRDVPVAAAATSYAQRDYGLEVATGTATAAGDGWAIDGGKTPQTAVFEFAEPILSESAALLRLTLGFRSRHGQHVPGRLRLGLGTNADAVPIRFGTWHELGPLVAPSGNAFTTSFGPETGVDLDAAIDGATWTARPEYADGKVHAFQATANAAVYLHRVLDAPSARRLVLRLGSDDGIRVWLNGEEVLANDVPRPVRADQERVELDLRAGRNELLLKIANRGGGFGFTCRTEGEWFGGAPHGVLVAARAPSSERRPSEATALRRHYRREHAPAWQALDAERADLTAQKQALEGAIPQTMVMAERAEIRPAHVLDRGRYDHPGEAVEPGVPDCLPPLSSAVAGRRATRLDLARWLVSGDHPLVARVFVNRLWTQLFGVGIVATPEDFGTRGAPPSDLELLDWLAAEFVASGWDVRHLLRTIVTSATYRQSSSHDGARGALPPTLWARGPRHRLDAEVLRDQALAVSGLLNPTVGGPPVKPYQPQGIWRAVGYTSSNTARFTRDTGDKLYRRSLYTFWKRTAPPPTMALLDAPSREACSVHRLRTNTPLQALAMLNDVQFVEAARAFAERLLRDDAADDDARLAVAFRTVTSRTATDDELAVLRRVLTAQRAEYADDPAAAAALVEIGESTTSADFEVRELASWTCVANLLLNLDEAVTKG